MSESEMERIARVRAEYKVSSTDHFDEDAIKVQLAGVRGEAAFADRYGLPYDSIRATGGPDGGTDFAVDFYGGVRLTFDVKTRAVARADLLVPMVKFEKGRLANYFVLGRCIGKEVSFIGWEDPVLVRCIPPVKLRVQTHVRPHFELRPMRVLDLLMARRHAP
jgi:hypothetical protein